MIKKRGQNVTSFGYARVSTDGQTLASQDAQLHAAGCAKVYAEKVSGARSDRPELAKLLRRHEPGDVLMVTRPDRLARSTRDLLNILHMLGERSIGFKSLGRRLVGRVHLCRLRQGVTKLPVTKSGGRPPFGEKAMTGAERMTQAARHSPSACSYANGLRHCFPSTPLPSVYFRPPGCYRPFPGRRCRLRRWRSINIAEDDGQPVLAVADDHDLGVG